jgi:UDP-3-O-[3-hydroxymyristoyl] N-acetylglucosamine deacetylase
VHGLFTKDFSTMSADIYAPVIGVPTTGHAGSSTNFQATTAQTVTCRGISLHGGSLTTLTIMPAEAGSGICFRRSDLAMQPWILADWRVVAQTPLCTTLMLPDAQKIATIEHLMAAFWAAGIDNAQVLVDGPELPILDGSAMPYLQLLADAGRVVQSAPRRVMKLLKPLRIEDGDRWVELLPFDGFAIDFEIDFANPVIGRQRYIFNGDPAEFTQSLAAARTFGFLRDVEPLRAQGLVLGASTENSLVVGDDQVMNPGGLRFVDEFVRHKVLDCVGDFMMVGAHLQAKIRAYKSGHAMNSYAVQRLVATPDAWVWSDGSLDLTYP